jgi:hypothetical protein
MLEGDKFYPWLVVVGVTMIIVDIVLVWSLFSPG